MRCPETQFDQGERLTPLEAKVDTGIAHITALLTNLTDERTSGDNESN